MLELVKTADGSNTLFNRDVGEHYHSCHGALQESRHVFLKAGLEYWLSHSSSSQVSVLEVGFGTGLNFLLTTEHCMDKNVELNYTGIEPYPLDLQLLKNIEYDNYLLQDVCATFYSSYIVSLEKKILISDHCELEIIVSKLLDFQSQQLFDIVYFDAFASARQPEMWTVESISHVCKYMRPGGVFVTYAITGDLKRTMKLLGFTVHKIQGAPGKREMLRAIKN